MQVIVQFVKDFLVPGSSWFLMIGASAGVLLLRRSRTECLGRRLLAALLVTYWIISVPVVAYGLQRLQRSGASTAPAGLPAEAIPIVVLGNGLGGYSAAGAHFEVPLGQTALNTLFAVARYRATPDAIVIASGGTQPEARDGAPEASLIRYGLVRNGVPAERIVLESRSVNTHDQAVEVAKILRGRGQDRCILVTSSQQMRRAVDLFRRERIEVIPYPADSQLWGPEGSAGWWAWVAPSAEARAVSRDVIYELMAWPYYRLRGWIA